MENPPSLQCIRIKFLKQHIKTPQGRSPRGIQMMVDNIPYNPTNATKLDTYRLFHPSFHTVPYLNTGPHTSAQAPFDLDAPTIGWTSNWGGTPKPPEKNRPVDSAKALP